jgi:membrane protease YdiL (CAAX protease family)
MYVMRKWIRRLPFQGEFAIVIFAAFGLPLASTIRLLLTPQWWLHGAPSITSAALLSTLIFEVVVGSLLWQLLVLRGWARAQVGLSPVHPWSRALLTTPLAALGLALAAYVTYAILALATVRMWPELVWQAWTHRPRVAPGLPITTVLAVSLINPVFEEVFVCGYVVSSLRERLSVAKAVNVSAGIRVAYHLYQGPMGVLSITPFALIAAIWFGRTRRLAPLILAHALVDFTGLSLGSWKLS